MLEQILAPDQYDVNVKTKPGSDKLVEFAVKLPGRAEGDESVYLPIDAKFPKMFTSNSLTPTSPETCNGGNHFPHTRTDHSQYGKDIRDKILAPPHTTDFGIMFCLREHIRRGYPSGSLAGTITAGIPRDCHGADHTGCDTEQPTNGIPHVGHPKRSSEVWRILGGVKAEFEKFGGLLEKAQKISNR